MTTYPLSLGWIKTAWKLYLQHLGLWVPSALVQVITFLFTALMLAGQFHPTAHSLLSSVRFPAVFDRPSLSMIESLLVCASLAANTAMTAMSNHIVRGEAIGVGDLFRFRNFGVVSLVQFATLLAVLAGSLIFFAGSVVAAGLLLTAQSTALRTGKFGTALRLSAAFMRENPLRSLSLGAFLILISALGVLTGGLGLLVALPMAKIVGALADASIEAHPVPGAARELVPFIAPFRWTLDEEAMLRRTAPQPQFAHVSMFLLISALSAALLLSAVPAGIASWISPQKPAQTASEPPTFSEQAPSQPPPLPESPVVTEPILVSAYDADAMSALPCRMHWGSYTVRIERIRSEESTDGRQERISVFDRTGSLVYTVTNEYIGLVKPEPLLGGETPELLIHTGEGGDGAACMDLALTQKGGIHNLFVLHGKECVRALPVNHQLAEEIVVDTRLDDGPTQGTHDCPMLTSTYRWDGKRFVNAAASLPKPTRDRITQDERTLLDSVDGMRPAGEDEDDWTVSLERADVELLANATFLGLTNLPTAVTSTPGYRMGAVWLSEHREESKAIDQTIEAAKNPLPIFAGSAIDDQSAVQDEASAP